MTEMHYVNQETVNILRIDDVYKVIQDNAEFLDSYHYTEILITIILVLKH
jgi:hypothetical protein